MSSLLKIGAIILIIFAILAAILALADWLFNIPVALVGKGVIILGIIGFIIFAIGAGKHILSGE